MNIFKDIGKWSNNNFGLQISKKDGRVLNELAPLIGIMEELGEYFASENEEDIRDALEDASIYFHDLCYRLGLKPKNVAVVITNFEVNIMIHFGKLCHIILKTHQGIRGFDDCFYAQEQLQNQLSIVYSTLMFGVQKVGGNTEKLFYDKISKRDWVANPKNG